MLIVRQLRRGDRRFAELRHAIDGISEKMLAQTLRTLERNGLVLRTSYDVVPPHVSYSLTPLGHECAEHVSQLLLWFETRAHEFNIARHASA
ncbi:MAG: helix-turn-helix transcriptional regulator [Candidatus Eremiobacteraeota bacterium]|nr:helix-turn-helix transcriptional regulator [Candidatus Eremiobacteraeota bacterium]